MLTFHIFLCCCMQCSACRKVTLDCAARTPDSMALLPGVVALPPVLHAAQLCTDGSDSFCCNAAPSVCVAAKSVRLCFHIHSQNCFNLNCFYMHYLSLKVQHWFVSFPLDWFENHRICFQSWKEAAEATRLCWSSDSTAALSAACAFWGAYASCGSGVGYLKGKIWWNLTSRTCCYMWYLSGIYRNRMEIPDLGSETELQKH